jgi:hypothetical protein
MFRFSYIPFLSVTFLHEFYADGISHDFNFTPLPGTAQLLESYGLKLKNPDGILSLYQQHDQNNQPFQEIDSVLDLYFAVTVRTDILNVTERFGDGRYFFSNLKRDGSYSSELTHLGNLSSDDVLPEVFGQKKMLYFPSGTISSISLSQLSAGNGWVVVQNYVIPNDSAFLELNVNKPGLYRLEKSLTNGTKEQTVLFLSDELIKFPGFWSVIHLQVKPGDHDLILKTTLTSKKLFWQYFLVEMKGRTGGPIVPANLEVIYKADPPSRYPSNMNLQLKDASTYSDLVKKQVASILSASNIKEVYLFETAGKLPLLDGQQPQLKIKYLNKEIAGNVSIPSRSMNKTNIIYKL